MGKLLSRRTCDIEGISGLDTTGIGSDAVLFGGSGFDLGKRSGSVTVTAILCTHGHLRICDCTEMHTLNARGELLVFRMVRVRETSTVNGPETRGIPS